MNPKEYLDLPYGIVLRHMNDKSGSYYFATVEEMPGCMSDGATQEEALANIRESMELWIEGKIESGLDVPMPMAPESNKEYSGKYVVWLPKSLHARLALEADKEGVSLNQYTLYKLSV
ncbi:MAG: toxin-antitoxin system HicB family antitoxin [Oscillospiraceae bacterium]|jgi:predicted RNase H-like HicB family nuclease|nr:toxin-antitoxin system HicB family antitoxin [Oscillospiraceae bacterium]